MQIRKSSLRYIKCQGGDLHSGQLMNLICVDERCNYRGLICPICKLQSHDDHYILPIKAFLDQIAQTFLKKEESSEINTVGDYLRSMEKTKKELTKLIRKEILELSQLFKELQLKIQEYYLSLRRNVLIQSSINTKLPNLIDFMLTENNYSELDIQQEFKKYCELLKYKDSKLVFSDRSKKLVQMFQHLPERFSNKVAQSLQLFKKELKSQGDLLAPQKIDQQLKVQPIGYKFSVKQKSENIELDAQCLVAKAKDKGFVFIDKTLSNQEKLIFKLVHQECEEIIIGIGDRSKFQAYHYNNNEEKTSLQLFVTSNGYTHLTAFDSDGSDSQTGNKDQCFLFEAGARVSIAYNSVQQKVQFTHLGTLQTFSLTLKESLLNSDKWNLFFGISGNDIIQLQPNQ